MIPRTEVSRTGKQRAETSAAGKPRMGKPDRVVSGQALEGQFTGRYIEGGDIRDVAYLGRGYQRRRNKGREYQGWKYQIRGYLEQRYKGLDITDRNAKDREITNGAIKGKDTITGISRTEIQRAGEVEEGDITDADANDENIRHRISNTRIWKQLLTRFGYV